MVDQAEITVTDLNSAYAAIMDSIVQSGHAPHYAELAGMLDVSPDRSRAIMHELCAVTPGWMPPALTGWRRSRRSTCNPRSTESPSMTSMAGSDSEVSSRWQFAGSSLNPRFASRHRVWTVVIRCALRCGVRKLF